MKTPNLIDVPKTHLSRKDRIAAFKKENHIATHDGGSCEDDFGRWMAVHMPSVYTLGYGVKEGMDVAECFALVGRLIEEAGYCHYGPTEAEAIRRLCVNLQINCTI